MLLPLRALRNPLPDQFDFAIAQLIVPRIGGRHPHRRIDRSDPLDNLARRRIASHESRLRASFGIETQRRFAIARVRTMAGKAFVRKDGPDIAVEFNRGIGREGHASEENHNQFHAR